MSKPCIFICYSHEDGPWLDRLLPFIRLALEECEHNLFTDKDIKPGERWEARIREEIAQATVALLLISIDALKSDFIRRIEIPLFQQFKQERDLQIIPILVRSCPYQRVSWLRELQMLPGQGQTLAGRDKSGELDDAMTEIALKIVQLVDPVQDSKTMPERSDRAYAETSSQTILDRPVSETHQSILADQRKVSEANPNLSVLAHPDRMYRAFSPHGVPDRPYAESGQSTAEEPQPGRGAQTQGTPGFIKSAYEYLGSRTPLATHTER
jgi:hypothetical protein